MSCQAQSIAISAAPAQSIAIQAQSIAVAQPVQHVENRWADYSSQEQDLGFPALPEPDYRCYQAPTVPQGQTRYLNVNEPAQVKNVEQNFNDQRTAVRENNTHVQRNRTQVTNVNRNHNHLLRIVTNENNYEHNLLNKVVRVADIHRQRIENVKGETRNFKDFKQTQKVENGGCRRADGGFAVQAACAPAQAQAISIAQPAFTQASIRTVRSARYWTTKAKEEETPTSHPLFRKIIKCQKNNSTIIQ